MKTVIVVPSLKISGGNREALRLANDLNCDGNITSLLSLWVSPHEMDCSITVTYLSAWTTRALRAFIELPILAFRFVQWWRNSRQRPTIVIFTHYATLPLALLIPRPQRFFFIQGVEWNFVNNSLLSWFLRFILLGIYKTGRVISANSYLTQRFSAEGLDIFIEAPIWADAAFVSPDAKNQDIDFTMVLAKSRLKRLDLYLDFITLADKHKKRIAVITPENEIFNMLSDKVDVILLRPALTEMRDLYSRSHCFIHLSENEGFGLPPLESMAAGCIAVCRDSGGVRVFMSDSPYPNLLMPLSVSIEEVFDCANSVVRDPQYKVRRTAVRAHFKRGLERSIEARMHLVDLIQKASVK